MARLIFPRHGDGRPVVTRPPAPLVVTLADGRAKRPAVAPYRPALTLGAAVALFGFVTWLAGPAVAISTAIISGAWAGLAWAYAIERGRRLGRAAIEPHLRDQQRELRRLEKRNEALDSDFERVSARIEQMANRWENLTPAIPLTCVRDLRALLGTRLGAGG